MAGNIFPGGGIAGISQAFVAVTFNRVYLLVQP
jgi:hypothetical protein